MDPTIFRVRCDKRGEHVHMTFFRAHARGQTFENLGVLVGDVGDYQLLLAMIGLGCQQSNGHAALETTGWTPGFERPEHVNHGQAEGV